MWGRGAGGEGASSLPSLCSTSGNALPCMDNRLTVVFRILAAPPPCRAKFPFEPSEKWEGVSPRLLPRAAELLPRDTRGRATAEGGGGGANGIVRFVCRKNRLAPPHSPAHRMLWPEPVRRI